MHSLFELGQHVRHKKSGGVYVITDLPVDNRLESTAEPAYGYKLVAGDGIKWWRSQTAMEDGRFTKQLIED